MHIAGVQINKITADQLEAIKAAGLEVKTGVAVHRIVTVGKEDATLRSIITDAVADFVRGSTRLYACFVVEAQ